MKTKRTNLSSQIMIVIMAAVVLGLMLEAAQAQVLEIDMPQKSILRSMSEKTTLSYYHQILGPTVSGPSGETYNVFQEARSPYQSFHAASLRYDVNPDWALGVSLAAVNAYGDTVTNQQTGFKSDTKVRDEFFNARAFINLPSFETRLGTLFTTFSYEAPSSIVARQTDMRYGLVLGQGFAFKLPSVKWTAGLNWQYYRAYYKQNVVNIPANFYFQGSRPETISRQTAIMSGGPYANYRFSDRWAWGGGLTFDWDQRGAQTSSRRVNNNLPDRMRTGVTYFPSIKHFTSIGLFTQALIKYTSDTHSVGGELALKF